MKSAITGKDPLMGFSASPAMQASIVRWAENQPDKPSLPEALRRLVELGLTVKAPRKQSQGGRAERAKDLATRVIDSFPVHTTDVEETASRKRRLIKGPEEFRNVRVDRAKK
jgi:ribosomal protein L28